jgi:hypothetical protein
MAMLFMALIALGPLVRPGVVTRTATATTAAHSNNRFGLADLPG